MGVMRPLFETGREERRQKERVGKGIYIGGGSMYRILWFGKVIFWIRIGVDSNMNMVYDPNKWFVIGVGTLGLDDRILLDWKWEGWCGSNWICVFQNDPSHHHPSEQPLVSNGGKDFGGSEAIMSSHLHSWSSFQANRCIYIYNIYIDK